jgi:glycosyltransferase involved in cell wall biosynthesis
MSRPLVSVVIPAYNGGALLRAAVDSVLLQDYQPVEVVVIDDGSTEPIEPALADVTDRIRIIRQPNAGTAAARNRGIQESRGEFVAFLDQDDLWDREKLAVQMPLFDQLEIALAHAGARFIDTAGNVTSVVTADPNLDTHALLEACTLAVQTAVVRRAALDAVGGFDESLSAADDWDLWIRIVDRFPIAAAPATLATIRVHGGNQSRDPELMYSSARRLIAKHRRIHGACADCRRARRAAAISNRAHYYGRVREEARSLSAEGHRMSAIRLNIRALVRNPRALITTPLHHLHRLTQRWSGVHRAE